MTKSMKTTAALLVGAFLLAGTLPAAAQQAAGTGSGVQAGSGRALGLRDGSELRPAPKDGTGFGSSFGGISAGSSTRGSGTGTQCGTVPQGSQGSRSQGSATRRGRS